MARTGKPAGDLMLSDVGPVLDLDLDSVTIPEIQQRMAAGRLTAAGLAALYLHRISRIDGCLRSILLINPGIEQEAAEADGRRALGRVIGPLDGIPVLLKDNIDTVWSPTTAGSRALLRSAPTADAVLVRRLREAGAVILGKANMSEWGNFRSIEATSGWSGVGGQTNNPHVLDRSPCGSSSGCGAAVAASLTQVAVGVETDGSLMCPAGMNGIVAHKPSLGLVPRTGLIPVSLEQDTAGPMARHVIDAAITLSVLQSRDECDAATAFCPADQPADYASALSPGALRGQRVGIWRLAGRDADVDRVMDDAAATVTRCGATVVDVELPYHDDLGTFPVLLVEFRRDLERYLASRDSGPTTIAELIEFNRLDPVELSIFGQEVLEQAAAAPSPDDPDYRGQRQRATTLARRSIDEVMARHGLDVIMAPTNGPAWKTDYDNIDAFVVGSSAPAAVAGYPSTAVPAGSAGPLPVGVSFFAGRWADAQVLFIAYAFEQAAHARRTPRFQRTLTRRQRRERRKNSPPGVPEQPSIRTP
jgi:amidase